MHKRFPYTTDFRTAFQMELDLKIFRMHRQCFPQERISERLGIPQKTAYNHLAKMAVLPKWLNT